MLDNALTSGTNGTRVADDVILTNVIGFDVKAWDPTAGYVAWGTGAYVDLGYNNEIVWSDGTVQIQSLVDALRTGRNATNTARVYDTYSTHYEALAGIRTTAWTTSAHGIVDDDAEKTDLPALSVSLARHPGEDPRFRAGQPADPRSDRGAGLPAAVAIYHESSETDDFGGFRFRYAQHPIDAIVV